MSIKDAILSWVFRNMKIRKFAVINILDSLDADSDGYIEADELVTAIKNFKVRR